MAGKQLGMCVGGVSWVHITLRVLFAASGGVGPVQSGRETWIRLNFL